MGQPSELSHGGTAKNMCYPLLDKLTECTWGKEFNLLAIQTLLSKLGDPHAGLTSVHVAGTNGKGSTCAAIARTLFIAGKRVGVYTSPHLSTPRERIRINEHLVPRELFAAVLEQIETFMREMALPLSYFEVLTAAAFRIFRNANVDYAVVEVGLGGRLDATNVIPAPSVVLITSIDLDHTEMLGRDYASIATEKAGILKPGSPAVIGPVNDAAAEAIRRCAEAKGVTVYWYGEDFSCIQVSGGRYRYEADGDSAEFRPSLRGKHQASNMALSIYACRLLGIPLRDCLTAVESTLWPGRLEQLALDGTVYYLDCAHNPAGARALAEYISSQCTIPPVILFGAIATKDWRSMVDAILPVAGDWILYAPRHLKAVDGAQVADYLSSHGVKSRIFTSVHDIHAVAGERAAVITGSTYVVGPIREMLLSQGAQAV